MENSAKKMTLTLLNRKKIYSYLAGRICMSVLIVNTTGNQAGFEKKFCSDLSSMISAQTTSIDLRGKNLLDSIPIGNGAYEIVVIVSHAGINGTSGTILDCGFGWSALDNPTILTQLLSKNPIEHCKRQKISM